MNDRLRIASEQLAAMMPMAAEHGVRVDGEKVLGCQNDVLARAALTLADALLASAGEQADVAEVAFLRSRVRELENIISNGKADNECLSGRIEEERNRAEAADAKCADLERENAALRRRAEPLTADEALTIKVDTASDLATAWIMADKAIMDAKSRRSSDG